ncbi:MAG: YbaK/EbsC family protein [Betaproteobacteria bacterium]|nr:YbaK/EbsC family protein [Betaproteobacteria bacterium]
MSAVLSNPSVERVRAALVVAGLSPDIVELPGAARTALAAAQFLGCEPAQIANSLVFRAQTTDSAVLVMSSGAKRVSTTKLSGLVGESIGKADADFVRLHTGFAIGGVAPAGHTGNLRRYVERSLAAYAEIWAAAGHPSTVFRLTYADLVRITGGVEADLAA